MNVVFIAPPAAGKGTQATLLRDNYNFYHISTGDVLREIAETNTPLGCEIKALIDNTDTVFLPSSHMGAMGVIVGQPSQEDKELASKLTARYSKGKDADIVTVKCGLFGTQFKEKFDVKPATEEEIKEYII